MNKHKQLVATMRAVVKQGSAYAAQLSAADLATLTGEGVWLANDRGRMVNAINTVVQGSMEVTGIPPVHLSAETLACAIASLVSHQNWSQAVSFMGERYNLTAEARGVKPGVEKPVTPRQFYALVEMAHAQDESYIAAFQKKINALVRPGQGQPELEE